MIEFGSDFHICDAAFRLNDAGGVSIMGMYGSSQHSGTAGLQAYASGRHAIDAVIIDNGWKRIWIPAYFCYEVIAHLQASGIEVALYDDCPLNENDDAMVRSLPYQEGDVLLRMNYFGLRNWRTNKGISVPVIEDHTHDLTSEWAGNSDADFCIASIRKSLPVAAGGILWSPKKLPLPDEIMPTKECEKMASLRYEGMRLKQEYIQRKSVDKNEFRAKFLASEGMIGRLGLSGMDRKSKDIANIMDIVKWTGCRAENWHVAYNLLKDKFTILKHPEDNCSDTPFSLVFLCNTPKERTVFREHLIENEIYPAILWQVPENTEFKDALYFSRCMLSIHVDARYDTNAIIEMCGRINECQNKHNGLNG